MSAYTLAAAQYPVSSPASWDEAAAQLQQWVAEAAAQGARLLVFPEYAAMSLAAWLPTAVRSDLQAQLQALQHWRKDYLAWHCTLAQRHQVYILAGSFPWRVAPQRYHNRAWLCAPDGGADYQDKAIMTRFEREHWGISGGAELTLFDTALGRIGVQICYDIEFPLPTRALVAAGATLLLTPSCTDSAAGYHRVRVGAQARALESQCWVVQAPLVGRLDWSPAIDVNCGAAGIYAPPDLGFPDDGVLAAGVYDTPGWVYAEIDPARVAAVRAHGQVFNYQHWHEQSAVLGRTYDAQPRLVKL